MNNYYIRLNPVASDIERVKEILTQSNFFNNEEVLVGVSLVKEKLNDLENCSYKFIFLETQDGVVGYSCYGFIEGTKSSFDLYWIAVDQKYKRCGFGTILLNNTENSIKNCGGKNIYIETSSTEKYLPTRLFYSNAGYKKEAEIKDFYDVNDNKIIFTKNY